MDFTAPKLQAQKQHSRISAPGFNAPARVVHAFDRWALVPAADLLMLRHAIESFSLAAAGEAGVVLHFVEEELRRRSAVLPAAGAETACCCTPGCSSG